MSRAVLAPLVARYGLRAALRIYAGYRMSGVLPRGTRIRVPVPDFAHPLAIRSRTTDGIVLKQSLIERAFDNLDDLKPRFIIDAGANIGVASAFLATRFPDARVVAVELERGNYELLRDNMRPYPNVTCLHGALWSHGGKVTLQFAESAEWAFQAQEAPGSAPDAIAAWSVADLLDMFDEQWVDLLKLDIEGGEREVFGPSASEWLDKVGVIMVELHDAWIPNCTTTLERAIGGRHFHRSRQSDYTVLRRASGLTPSAG